MNTANPPEERTFSTAEAIAQIKASFDDGKFTKARFVHFYSSFMVHYLQEHDEEIDGRIPIKFELLPLFEEMTETPRATAKDVTTSDEGVWDEIYAFVYRYYMQLMIASGHLPNDQLSINRHAELFQPRLMSHIRALCELAGAGMQVLYQEPNDFVGNFFPQFWVYYEVEQLPLRLTLDIVINEIPLQQIHQ